MKWLKDEAYNAMKQAADSWNKLLSTVMENNPDLKEEDITPESLLASLENDSADTNLQDDLKKAQNELTEKNSTIENLQSTIEELKASPSNKKTETSVTKEVGAGQEDIKEFADKNSDNTVAIMDKARETGFFNL